MDFHKQARHCHNCYHTWHACQENRQDACADYEHRRQGIHRQLRMTEIAIARTMFGGIALLLLAAATVAWTLL